MNESKWQFWIDVGGTFTDCVARLPEGSLRRHKVLSSGVTKGTIATGSTRTQIIDLARARDPDRFWVGYSIRVLNNRGETVAESTVVKFDAEHGRLELTSTLPVESTTGTVYELFSQEEAPLVAIRYLLGLSLASTISPCSVRLGTTRGTNALLTRRGARTAFITTRGFGDILKIGYQNRPRLFDLNIRKPEPLYETTLEIDERLAADGTVLQALNVQQVRNQLAELKQAGIESLAICLLHAYNHPRHEQRVAEIARELGFAEISVSSSVAPLERIVARGDTTVVDAFLNPVLQRYVASLAKKLPESDLRLLTSAGGLVRAERFSGKESILSGPAGGVVGFSRVAQAAGFSRAIGFDMGGTSTDVSRFDGQYEREFETEKAGVRIVAPMMAIETVAAGGGSICRFDGVKLVVGPESAGAEPGPACYGRGGPLTVTDVNLWLGRIAAAKFPFALDRQVVQTRLQEIAGQMQYALGKHYDLDELAEGFVRVANTKMAAAVRSISIAKGYDSREYVLVAFGGAAGQHACAVARELGMTTVLCHPDAGLLSAYGAGLADVERHRVIGICRPYSTVTLASVERDWVRLESEARAEIVAEGVVAERVDIVRSLELCYQGTDATLTIPCPADGNYEAAFIAEHRRRYGYIYQRPLEVVAVRLEARGQSAERLAASHHVTPQQTLHAVETSMAMFNGQQFSTAIIDRDQLRPGVVFTGPAIVCEASSTTVIEPNWRAEVLSDGELLLTAPSEPLAGQEIQTNTADPIQLELFNNHFTTIATQMGITLRNTASSVNVKERLDFSCAIFTAQGDLVVNAPHVPVHLGSMAETVRRVIADNPAMRPGDVFVSNDPYGGGSHLPDVTVITPVHAKDSGERLFFTASRAHHAEIGGITPGSMPPFSRTLAEEGVLIRNFKLIAAGEPQFDPLQSLLVSGPRPTRDVETNLADIAAQVAANQQGSNDLLKLAERMSVPVVRAYMRFIQEAAEQKVRQALARLPQGMHRFVDHLDDGSPICVVITLRNNGATIDFTGTGPVLPSNLNANRAIVTAAVMYVLRLLIDEDIPLNQGVLAPVEIVLPECLLNPPAKDRAEDCAAVVGGNVETSQRVVDVLLGALGLAAASQGTMNNVLFGDNRFGYYETICGGAGATATAAGADAVHTHMTNTRLTDPEVLERRYPVRLHEFSIRRGSGGDGCHRGGDGVVRRIEFLQPLEVSILSQRRGPYAPYGSQGGGSGELGRNQLQLADGTVQDLGATAQFTANPGDMLVIKTPGGGGFDASQW